MDQHTDGVEGAEGPAGAADTVGYVTGRATKQQIVESAAAAFAVTGFYGTSLRAVAREAGVDHSTLLHHFGNKTALLLAVIEWHDRRNLTSQLPGADDAVAVARGLTAERLAEQLTATAARNSTTPGLVQLLSVLSAEAGAEGHPAREALRARHEALTGVLAEHIETQRRAGALPDDGLDPHQHAVLVLAAWEGLQTYDALHPGEIDVPALLSATLRRELGVG